MKLNLGCGRLTLPLVRGAEKHGEHTKDLPDTVYEPGWVNVDKFAMPGVQEVVDLFRYPWVRASNGSPWNDSSVDEIWCSHLVEHIPHEARVAGGLPPALRDEYQVLAGDLDGFFVFFYECWRVLKPGGTLYVSAPYGPSLAGITDPTHTRYMTPGTFDYMVPNPNAPFDYHLPMVFTSEPVVLRFTPDYSQDLGRYSTEGIERLLRRHFNVVDEMRMTLRAVKD